VKSQHKKKKVEREKGDEPERIEMRPQRKKEKESGAE